MDLSHLVPGDKRLLGDWQEAPVQGKESRVWIQGDLVLQERPVTLMDNTKKALEILEPLKGEPEFHSVAGEIVAGEGIVFYTLWPRVRGKSLRFPKRGEFPDWENLQALLPALARSLEKLHNLPLTQKAYSVPKNPIVASRIAGREWILSSLESKIGLLPTLPPEPESRIVVSHGDLALHNMFYQEEEIFLFDWSNLSALRRDADAAHFVQSILAGLDPKTWPEIIHATHVLAPYLDLEEWTAALLWSLARSAAVWSAYHPAREGFLADQKRIDTLLDFF